MKKINLLSRKMTIFLLVFSLVLLNFTNAQPWQGKGRIVISSDGNQHDSDDWGATAVSLSIIANRGLQSKLVAYTYCDHIWDNNTLFENNMNLSAVETAKKFNFNMAAFVNAYRNQATAQNMIRDAINASSVDNPLFFILAGPVELGWRGINASTSSKRQFVTCISHSSWNNNHAKTDHGGHNDADIRALGVKWIQITDQNANRFNTGSMTPWTFLNSLGGGFDAAYKYVYTRVNATYTKGDASDCGMIYYLFTNDQDGNPAKLANFMKSGSSSSSSSSGGAPIGKVVYFKGNNGQYVSSNNGTSPMRCNKTSVGTYEKFDCVDAGGGLIALKGNNGKYVSSENGSTGMNCNRGTIGAWEKFTWVVQTSNSLALKGSNGMYVSSENGTADMLCNRGSIGAWEKFGWATTTRSAAEETGENHFSVYPNPVFDKTIFIEGTSAIVKYNLQLINLHGQVLVEQQIYGSDMYDINLEKAAPSGVYFVIISNEMISETQKIIVK